MKLFTRGPFINSKNLLESDFPESPILDVRQGSQRVSFLLFRFLVFLIVGSQKMQYTKGDASISSKSKTH